MCIHPSLLAYCLYFLEVRADGLSAARSWLSSKGIGSGQPDPGSLNPKPVGAILEPGSALGSQSSDPNARIHSLTFVCFADMFRRAWGSLLLRKGTSMARQSL
jgi:hypothetical protein